MLPLIQRIMNATIHSATGETPANLLFSGAVNIDRELFIHAPNLDDDENARRLGDYVEGLVRAERLLLDVSQLHQQQTNAENLAKRRKGPSTVFPINSYVLVQYPMTRMGRRAPTKLHMPLKGPFRVESFVGDKYTVVNMVNSEKYVYHVTQLQPFHHDPRRVNPNDIALHDTQAYIVESIVNHEGTVRERNNLRFLVKWEGYDAGQNTWEPYHELRHNEHLHAYLREHRMRTLFPSQYR